MLAQWKLCKQNPVISIGIAWNYGEKVPHAGFAQDQFGHMIIVLINRKQLGMKVAASFVDTLTVDNGIFCSMFRCLSQIKI